MKTLLCFLILVAIALGIGFSISTWCDVVNNRQIFDNSAVLAESERLGIPPEPIVTWNYKVIDVGPGSKFELHDMNSDGFLDIISIDTSGWNGFKIRIHYNPGGVE